MNLTVWICLVLITGNKSWNLPNWHRLKLFFPPVEPIIFLGRFGGSTRHMFKQKHQGTHWHLPSQRAVWLCLQNFIAHQSGPWPISQTYMSTYQPTLANIRWLALFCWSISQTWPTLANYINAKRTTRKLVILIKAATHSSRCQNPHHLMTGHGGCLFCDSGIPQPAYIGMNFVLPSQTMPKPLSHIPDHAKVYATTQLRNHWHGFFRKAERPPRAKVPSGKEIPWGDIRPTRIPTGWMTM